LLIGRLLWGLAWSGIWVGGATMILDVATPEERGRWTGLYQTWFYAGAALGALGGGILTDLLGYTRTMWVGASLTALGGGVALLLLPETSRAQETMHTGSVNSPAGSGAAHRSRNARGLGLRPSRELWLAVSVQGVNRFIISGVISATIGLLIQDWAESTGVTLGVATLTGVMMAGRTLLSVVAAPIAGTLSDRRGSRWRVIAWALVIGTAGMVLLAWRGAIGIVVGMLTVAISGGSLQSLATALTGDSAARSQRGRAIGLLHTAGDLGSALGPSVAYALLPALGLRAVYLLCAALFLISLGPVLTLPGRQ
jgi:MFS family permease